MPQIRSAGVRAVRQGAASADVHPVAIGGLQPAGRVGGATWSHFAIASGRVGEDAQSKGAAS